MSKVSVIIPVYNVEKYLRASLNTVCAQSLKDIEIICVNDGSTDSSLDILNEYALSDGRMVIISGPNGGYGKAMNTGLDAATGEYIGIVEPDDLIRLEMYEDLYRTATENDLDFVKADFYRFEHKNNKDIKMQYNSLDPFGSRYNEILDPSEDPSLIKFIMNTWSGIYRREFIENFHIRHNETPGASFQDNGFFFQTMIYAKRAMIIDQPYYINRRDNPDSSVKSGGKVYCANIEYDFIKDLLMEDWDIWERFKEMYSWKKFQTYRFTIDRIAKEYKLPYIRRMSAEFKRGYANGEFNRSTFTSGEWNELDRIMRDPDNYYKQNVFHEY